jgi:hypothetical protein
MDEIEDMIDEILRGYRNMWPTDIIDQVFVAIEKDPRRLKRYHEFADGDYGTTNSMIGRYVKECTGKKSLKESDKPKSVLIKSFTLLG